MRDWFKKTWSKYNGSIIGAAIGLTAAILMLTINFWRTLLLLMLIGGGALLGILIQREGVEGLWARILKLFSRKRR